MLGMRVWARDGGNSFFWLARITARDRHGQIRIEWEEPRAASPDSTDAPSSSSTGSPGGSEGGLWISERHAAFAEVEATESEVRKGTKAVAVWVDGHGYACEVLGSAGRRQLAVQFEDGLQYDCAAADLRILLDEPLFTNLAPEALQGRARLLDGEALNGPSAWSQRTVARSVWCSDSAQCGPLQRTVRKLVDTWRCDGLTSSGKSWVVEKGPVDGLFICRDFLSPEEVGALRLLFNAHNGWAMYNWGNIGRKSELASVLQRIDFGLPDMTAEGVAAQRSLVQPIGELQQQIIALLEARLRAAFGTVAWGGPCQPSSSRGGGAICRPALAPNMMQFTRIAPGTCLGNHFDRRDKWDEGIASIAWSEAAGTSDERGDRWTLRMQCGPPGPGQKDLTVEMPAGSAYIMGGIAQGRTGVCSMGRVAHEMCSCCWTHGVWNEASQITRESITLRVFTPNWGREGSKSDATLEDTKLPWGPEAASNANAD